jgi:hypothetical protein
MDGEMVVDEIEEPPAAGAQQQREGSSGGGAGAVGAKKQRRRYLAYDLMMINGEGIQDLKFGVRSSPGCEVLCEA